MQLSSNISLAECIRSLKALELGINNVPGAEEVDNLSLLAINCLQPIRSHFNKPLIITSGYRCKELNKAVKGAKNSQHITGQAVDFIVKGVAIKDIIIWVLNNLDFDQLIEEYQGNKCWIHLSYSKDKNRKEYLIYKRGVYKRLNG